MRAHCVTVLALMGCDQVFGLDGRVPLDATDPVDPTCRDPRATGNEDTDTLVDGCDNCPLITNQPQLDSDDDGIGDACDPNPLMPLEELVLFDALPNYKAASWEKRGNGNWMTGDGSSDVKQPNRGDDASVIGLLMYVLDPVDQPMVQIKVTSATPDDDPGVTGDTLSAIGVYVIVDSSINDATPDGMICGIQYPTRSATDVEAWSRVQDRGQLGPQATEDLASAGTSVITLATNQPDKAATDAVVPTCTVQRGTDVIAPISTSTIAPAGARIALWTMNTSATFSALFVTRRRAP